MPPHPGRVCCSSHHSIRCTLGELVLQAHSHQLHHCHMDASLIRTVSKQEKGNEAVNKKKRTILILFAVQPWSREPFKCVCLSIVQDETHLRGSPTMSQAPARQSHQPWRDTTARRSCQESLLQERKVARHPLPASGEGRPRACPEVLCLAPWVILSPENQQTHEEGNRPGVSHIMRP